MRYSPPYLRKQINLFAGHYTPDTVKSTDNLTFYYWCDALLERVRSTLSLEGVPENWTNKDVDFLFYSLFRGGYVACFDKIAKYGFTFQNCTLSGYSWHYQPTKAIVTHPALQNALNLKIGTDCEILRLKPDYGNIWGLIERYADKLAQLDLAIDMSIINNKFAWILAGNGKASIEALKKMLDQINQGNPAVFIDKAVIDNPKTDPFTFVERSNLKNNYLTTDQLNDMRTILDNFDNEIGIPNVRHEKKERLLTEEAHNPEASARITVWLETLNGDLEAINEKYGQSLKFVYNYEEPEPIEEVPDNG